MTRASGRCATAAAAALLGLAPGTIGFDINSAIIFKGATVHGIVGRELWGTWFRMRGLLNAGPST